MSQAAIQSLNNTVHVTDKMLKRHAQLKQTAMKWEAQTFFGTMLKQMRESPFKSDLFEGGRGGQAFSAVYDQELANRMARGAGAHLAGSIVRSIEGTRNYKALEAAEKQRRADLSNNTDSVRNHVPSTLRA